MDWDSTFNMLEKEDHKMRFSHWRVVVGVILLILGALFLLQSFDLLPIGGWLWSIPFAIVGIAFLIVLLGGKQNWWAVIPGIILLDLALIIILGEFAPDFNNTYGGTIFLAGMALTFLIVYLFDTNKWWAIIPMGVLATSSAVAALEIGATFETGAIFFIGLAGTFALLAILPTGQPRMKWPWIPALVMLAIAALISIGSATALGYIWPAALILAGIFIISRSLIRR
jgi:hypothetical protein